MAPLANTKVVIIGGSSGLGFGIAKAALAEGASVVLASSSRGKLDRALERLGAGAKATAEVLAVKNEAAVKAFFAKVGRFEHLTYSVGDDFISAFDELDLSSAKVRSSFDVRFWGVLLCAKHSKGYVTDSFTLTSGTASLHPVPGWTLTAAMGGAANSATANLALDLAPIRVNCIAPGLVATEMWDDLPDEKRDGFYKEYAEKLPVKHVGTAEELAEAYLFAMKCTFLTAETISVNGGSLII